MQPGLRLVGPCAKQGGTAHVYCNWSSLIEHSFSVYRRIICVVSVLSARLDGVLSVFAMACRREALSVPRTLMPPSLAWHALISTN